MTNFQAHRIQGPYVRTAYLPTKVEEKPATPEPKSNDNEAAKLIIDTGAEKPGYNFTLVEKQEELPQKQEEKEKIKQEDETSKESIVDKRMFK